MNKYIDIYPNCLVDGIGLFSALSSSNLVPWHQAYQDDITNLEKTFAFANSQKRFISTFLVLSEDARIKVLLNMFAKKWAKLWEIYTIQYNMLDAYILNETYEEERKKDRETSTNYGRVVSDEGTNTGTITNTSNENSSGNEGLYGFNSDISVDANTSSDSASSSGNEERNLTNTNTTTNSGTDSENQNDNETVNFDRKKTGNIGYTTPQQMLKDEIELWGEPFFKQVFNDITSFVMLQVYS